MEGRSAVRSQNAGLLVVPRVSRSSLGGRAFSYQAPVLWNQLPVLGPKRQTQCQCLRIDLKPSFLIKLIIRVGSQAALSYAPIGLDCCGGGSHDAPGTSPSSSVSASSFSASSSSASSTLIMVVVQTGVSLQTTG
ncbi:hypothetical protein L3Q82_017656 [Scortum barcoo]|uniref:Uncharacterized protein n=1 Tax=Scortum barcoo TaxID=214431 RepID=A0ACB8VPL9_9TELE|nr:hypothetical protein L3Q82_017656 [Scortum barcoo]